MLYLQGLVFVLYVLYGSVFVFGKLILASAPPLFVTGSRMILAGLLLLGYLFFFKRAYFKLKKDDWVPLLMVSFLGVYLTNAFEFWGLQYMEAGKACFLYSFAPIATALLSYAWLQERLSLQKWIGLLVGILGFIPLLFDQSTLIDPTPHFLGVSYAEWAILAAAVTSSLGWLAMQTLVKKRAQTGVMANATSMLIGGTVSLLHSRIVEPWDPLPISDMGSFLQWLAALTLVSNLICYNVHAYLLRHLSATYLSFVGLSQPLFAALLGWYFLNEVLLTSFWISMGAVSLGLYLYYRGELQHQKRLKPLA